jgi:hypothetical protein
MVPSFPLVKRQYVSISFTIGFIGLILFLIASSNQVSQMMKAWGIAISLVILAGYLFFTVRIFSSLEVAAAQQSLGEYRIDEMGVSFTNLLTGAQQWGLYLLTLGDMPDSTAILTRESTYIPWDDISSVEIHPNSMTILVGTGPWSWHIQNELLPVIFLVCTEDTFPVIQEFIRRSIKENTRVIESS